jgi:hypothetical protein
VSNPCSFLFLIIFMPRTKTKTLKAYQLRIIIDEIISILYQVGPCLDPTLEWDADTLNNIAYLLKSYNLVPTEEEFIDE